MKREKEIHRDLNKSIENFSAIFRCIVSLSLFFILLSTTSCKSDIEINSNLVYGLSLRYTFNKYEPDSLVQVDLSNGVYKNLSSTNMFEGLSSAAYITHSKNQNIIVYYKYNQREICIIHLDNLTSETIGLITDSTFMGIKSIIIIEEKNLLVLFQGHYNYADKSKSLDIVEINLKTKKNTNNISKLMDFDYSQDIFTAVDEKNNRIFLVPDNDYSKPTDILYIYNYQRKELTSQFINANFYDVHYSSVSQCLVGSSPFKASIGLISYSIKNQKTDTIGSYKEIIGIRTDMNYYDQKNNLYWIGILTNKTLDNVKFTNISLINANYSKSFLISKFVKIIN